MFDLVIKSGTCVIPDPSGRGNLKQASMDIGIKGGQIVELGEIRVSSQDEVFDAKGLHVLPGLIDTQVHFREPGLEHKEDLSSGTWAAIVGGITAVFDMPNTQPPTTTVEGFQEKVSTAQGRCWSHYAFYMGANAENARQLSELENLSGCCGVKIFMGSSTGNLLIKDDELLREALSSGKKRVAIHSEDEERLLERKELLNSQRGNPSFHPIWRDEEVALKSTQRLLAIARETGRPVHVLHVSTGQEMDLLVDNKDIASVECTPQHLTLIAPDCYERWGTLAQMNPPIRGVEHQRKLWQGIENGVVDIIGSDHAPHTKEEKSRPYPMSPSGMPGVQTIVPLMLQHVNEGRLSLERLVELMCLNPVRLFGIQNKGGLQKGLDADITVVDMNKESQISLDWLKYKCQWSPFEGSRIKGWPVATLLKGKVVMKDGETVGRPEGELLEFL